MPTSLSLHFWGMQGDFGKMQGGGKRNPVKSCQIPRAWMGVRTENLNPDIMVMKPCVYRKLKPAHSGDAARQGSHLM
jgi:hypothetical protein